MMQSRDSISRISIVGANRFKKSQEAPVAEHRSHYKGRDGGHRPNESPTDSFKVYRGSRETPATLNKRDLLADNLEEDRKRSSSGAITRHYKDYKEGTLSVDCIGTNQKELRRKEPKYHLEEESLADLLERMRDTKISCGMH